MTGGRVLVGEALLTGTGLEAARLHRRAALLSRTGGGTLISPVVGDERVLSPGVRHVPVRVAPGLTHENLVAEVADAVGALLGNGRFFPLRAGGHINFGYPKLLLQMQVDYADIAANLDRAARFSRDLFVR